jgi:hypothetical protein
MSKADVHCYATSTIRTYTSVVTELELRSLIAAVLKAFPIQRAYETQDETLGEGALLHRPAVGYKRPSGQIQLRNRYQQ